MNYPFSSKSSLSRFISVSLTSAMLLATLTGCSLIPSKDSNTDPSAENNGPSLNISETTEPTEPPTTEPTTPPTTEAPKENVAVVKEQLNARSSPSTGSRVIGQLDAGDEVEVQRIEPIGTVEWALIYTEALPQPGWVVAEMLDLSNVTLASNTTTPANTNPTAPTDPTTATTTPTTPIDSVTGTGTNTTTPANSSVGVVNTNTLNIRASASQSSEKVGEYTYGDRITILETSNGWGRTDKGWVSMTYVTVQQSNSTSTGTVTGTTLNIRSGAGTNYDVVGSLKQGDTVSILETTTVNGTQWGKISQGWISLDYVRMSGTTGTTGTTGGTTGGTATTGNATVTGTTLNIRTGAGTNYTTVGSLKQGDTVNILETVNVGGSQWGRINQGWICLDYVKMN